MDSSDPVIASYDVCLTDSQISRYVLQYLDRSTEKPYDAEFGQKPTALRLKPETGLIEVDIPIDTNDNYDVGKGLKYGEALKQSRTAKEGGAFGMAGGFNSHPSSSGGRIKREAAGDIEMASDQKNAASQVSSILRTQTLGGRIKVPEDGDPLYMLGAFRGQNLYLSPVSAVVQLRPQLHHIDASEEAARARASRRKDADDDNSARPETEARVVDVKVKSADGADAALAENVELLKKMQDEHWDLYEWVDANTEEAWSTYENYMIHNVSEDLPQLESAIDGEGYLDAMSAPRIDPARPEMTGWAMKQNRKKQSGSTQVIDE